MASNERDDNRIPVASGVSNVDGKTTVTIAVNPDNNGLVVEVTS